MSSKRSSKSSEPDMKPYYKPDFGFKKNPPGISDKKLASEEKKFRDSLKAFSREDLILLLGKLVMKNAEYEALLTITEQSLSFQSASREMLDEQISLLKSMTYFQTAKLFTRDKGLAKGRKIGTQKRQNKKEELESQLRDAIRQYLNYHSDRRVLNQELVDKLGKQFIGKGKYTEKTLDKKISKFAAEERRKIRDQNS